MQFPDSWLSEILKPLSDAIFVNSSVKLVLLLTLLARKCICWRSWMIRSNGPSREIIWGGFHWIIQCSSNKRFHLRKNPSNFRPNFKFNMISFCFFPHWDLFRYRHRKLSETLIWCGSATSFLSVKQQLPKLRLRRRLIQSRSLISYPCGMLASNERDFSLLLGSCTEK